MYARRMTSDLTRVTVNLIPKATVALAEVVRLTGDTKTDSINRALQAYAFFESQQREHGKRIWLQSKDGTMESVHLL